MLLWILNLDFAASDYVRVAPPAEFVRRYVSADDQTTSPAIRRFHFDQPPVLRRRP